jgi:hypothetical protein
MFDLWEPSLWIFGHHHVRMDKMFGRTRFICLPELGLADVKLDLTNGRYDVIM